MNQFTISQLQQLSGIKAHTIRVWEQRYNALNPNRSDGNTRYYDSQQLRRLLNIVSLLGQDYKVSQLCAMSDEELYVILRGQLAASLVEESGEYFVSQLIGASVLFDETCFDNIFSDCLHRFGLRNMYLNVIYPMLVRIGLMWGSDAVEPAHEHFVSNLLRRKISASIDVLPSIKSEDETWVLFLPENEFHEIGLLFSHFIIRQAGHKVVYLVANLPLDTLAKSVEQIKPSHLLFFFVHNDLAENAQAYMDQLRKHCPNPKLCVAGKQNMLDGLNLPANTRKILSLPELEDELDV